MLTAAYLVTRNTWVSAGAHIINDWTEFFTGLLLSRSVSHVPVEAGR